MNTIDLLIYSILTGFFWSFTYFFIRRLLNPNLNLLNNTYHIKNDYITSEKINKYYYDAIYGGIAIAISYFIMRNIRYFFKFNF